MQMPQIVIMSPMRTLCAFTGNAIQAFGNGTDVGVWQPQPPIEPTVIEPGITRRGKERGGNSLDALTDMSRLGHNGDSVYHFCGMQVKHSARVQKLS